MEMVPLSLSRCEGGGFSAREKGELTLLSHEELCSQKKHGKRSALGVVGPSWMESPPSSLFLSLSLGVPLKTFSATILIYQINQHGHSHSRPQKKKNAATAPQHPDALTQEPLYICNS